MKWFVFSVFCLFFLVGCAEEFPPAPSTPGAGTAVGRALGGLPITATLPSWAVPIKNTDISPVTVRAGDTLVVTIEKPSGLKKKFLAYSVVYAYNKKYGFWEKAFADTYASGKITKDWAENKAVFKIPITTERFTTGPNYVVTYWCVDTETRDSQGYKIWDCNGKKWGLGAFELTTAPAVVAANYTKVNVTKVDTPDPVLNGSQLNYTIVVTNSGTATASNVVVTESYPSGVSFISSTPSPSSGNNVFSLGNILPNTMSLVSIRVNVGGSVANGTVLNNSINITYTNASGSQLIRTSQPTTVITLAPSAPPTVPVANFTTITLTKFDAPDPVLNGSQLNYTIVVGNTGTVAASNVVVTESYPSGVVFHSSSPVPSSGNNVFSFGNLLSNVLATINIIVNVSSTLANGTVLNNSINVTYTNASGAQSLTASQPTVVLAAVPIVTNVTNVTIVPVCGNGINESGEQCGEPSFAACGAGKLCQNCICVVNPCGNGVFDTGEQCGEPSSPGSPIIVSCPSSISSPQVCANCRCIGLSSVLGFAVCGDGVVNAYAGEVCGEPGLPGCGQGKLCQNCRCIVYGPDTTNPTISNIRPSGVSFNFNASVRMSADVADNIAVGPVQASTTLPDSSVIRLNMNALGNGTFESNFAYTSLGGQYSFVIIANDTSNNSVMSSANTFNITRQYVWTSQGSCTPPACPSTSCSFGFTTSGSLCSASQENSSCTQSVTIGTITGYAAYTCLPVPSGISLSGPEVVYNYNYQLQRPITGLAYSTDVVDGGKSHSSQVILIFIAAFSILLITLLNFIHRDD